MEFDAIARFLQDVGNDDTDEAGFNEIGLAWVARRAHISVLNPATVREDLTMSTWCSGTGRRWAERRTSLVGESGGHVEAVAVWIHLDPATGRPTVMGDEFANNYLPAAGGRRIDSRLRLAKLPDDQQLAASSSFPWQFRATDTDAFGHVNNAAYLAIAEQYLDLDGPCDLTIEWRSPCTADDELTVTTSGDQLWIIDSATDESRAVIAKSALDEEHPS